MREAAQVAAPSDWSATTLGEVASCTLGGTPSTEVPQFWGGQIPWMASGDVHIRRIGDVPGRITEAGLAASNATLVQPPAVAIGLAGQGKTRGTVALTLCELSTNQSIALLRGNDEQLHTEFLFHNLDRRYEELRARSSGGGRGGLSKGVLDAVPIELPPLREQRIITEILDTLDTTIRQTEAIIEKLKQVKQGLLHDLLTRGIDANGELRPPQSQAPHLYKDSPLGWIPRGWGVHSVNRVSESVVDGPFGSNLKTEHYVPLPGVRVVRLQNIGIGDYDDSERAYVSELKARSLSRNQVVGGDVLVAALGDDRYPVGRACCYPVELPTAVNKADCFRLRPCAGFAIGSFVMRSLNGAIARRHTRGFEQGVTMQRVNLGNLKRVLLSMPPVAEQHLLCERLDALDMTLAANVAEASKLQDQKSGLMDDLLTGRVRVTPLLAESTTA